MNSMGRFRCRLSYAKVSLCRIQIGRQDGEQTVHPYSGRRFLLSLAERRFYEMLVQAVPAWCVVFSKVRLADLVYVRQHSAKDKSHFNRIQAKHVDFVLCDAKTSAVCLVVELDDRSHERPDRKRRDQFVDELLTSVRLPILHVAARRSYDVSKLTRRIQATLGRRGCRPQLMWQRSSHR